MSATFTVTVTVTIKNTEQGIVEAILKHGYRPIADAIRIPTSSRGNNVPYALSQEDEDEEGPHYWHDQVGQHIRILHDAKLLRTLYDRFAEESVSLLHDIVADNAIRPDQVSGDRGDDSFPIEDKILDLLLC